MKITNLQINNFGKLNNKNIQLQNGINVIYGKNESGKSTLLKFITGIFYGLNKNKNGQRISDYEKYTPWQEGEFSGKINYELDNGEGYEVYRNFTKKNPQIMDNFGNDLSKNFEIDKTSGSKFFVEQTKVDEELFNMSMVINEQAVKLDEKEQNTLIQKVSNIMSTGEDDVSYKKIISKLNKIQTDEIGTEKSPTKPLYLTKRKIEELKQGKQEVENVLQLRYELEEKKEKLKKEITEAEKELELMQEIKKIQNEEKIEEEKINVNKKAKQDIEEKKEEEEKNLGNVKTNEEPKKSYKELAIIPIVLIIVCIILFLLKQIVVSVIGVIIAVASIIGIQLLSSKEKKEYEKQKQQEKEEKNKIKNKIELLESEIKEKEKGILEKQNELNIKINTQKEHLKIKYININNIENIINKNIEDNHIIEEQKLINELKLKEREAEITKNDILKKIENYAQIEEELQTLEENLNELTSYNNSIEIAKEAMKEAYTNMKENVTPRFTENVQKTISNITGGKYTAVKINEENALMIETKNGNYVESDVLSIGTIDELYLSLRISSIKELSKENMPIILDETFAYFDDERLKNILTYLNEEYSQSQIIILTCTKREINKLEELGILYNKIEI